MTYTVSITSQGQISIPAPLRRKLGLDKNSKAIVSEEKGKILIEPVKDFLEMEGYFKTDIKASPKQIREAFGEHLAAQAIKGMDEKNNS